MRPPRRRPVRLDVTATTFVRAIVFAVLVLAWYWLWRWVLVFLIGVFLAVAIEPAVRWLGRHGVKRGYAAPLIVATVVAVLVGFLYMSASSLYGDAKR